MENNKIEIYQTQNNQIEVRIQSGETVWLNQKQMALIFDKDVDTIGLHLKNIYKENELNKKSTSEYFSVVQLEGGRNVNRKIQFYNLDAIISVGYRVNSKQGTLFRQWATQRLKDYLIEGAAVNHKRLKELSKTIEIIQDSIDYQDISVEEAKGVLEILKHYTQSFVLLNQFDSNRLEEKFLAEDISYEIKYEEAKKAISTLKNELIQKNEATELFGNEKDHSFEGVLGSVIQSFWGTYVYDSIEKQAAHLLYFIIKNHPFSDGNKRIGAFLFVWFLEKNKHRFKQSGEVKINDNGLVALSLLVAQSNPSDKELMISLIINLINKQ